MPSVKDGPGLTLADSPNEIPNSKKTTIAVSLSVRGESLSPQYHKAGTLRLVGGVVDLGVDGGTKRLGDAQS
jgi:hypothetical protein